MVEGFAKLIISGYILLSFLIAILAGAAVILYLSDKSERR